MPDLIKTDAGVSSVLNEGIDDVFCYLLEIDYNERETHLYYTNNQVSLVSGSVTYEARQFDIDLPTSNAERPPSARLSIDDADGFLIRKFRNTEAPPVLKFTVVRADNPVVVEGSIGSLLLKNISSGQGGAVIQGDVMWDSFVSEPYPSHRYDPSLFPGLFP